MEKGTLALPQPDPLLGIHDPPFQYVIVANEDFALSEHVLRPYAQKNLNHKKKILITN